MQNGRLPVVTTAQRDAEWAIEKDGMAQQVVNRDTRMIEMFLDGEWKPIASVAGAPQDVNGS